MRLTARLESKKTCEMLRLRRVCAALGRLLDEVAHQALRCTLVLRKQCLERRT